MTEQGFEAGTGQPGGAAPGARSFGERLVGAIKLDASVYEEVEHDPNAIGQAAAVVGLAAVASGIGSIGLLGVGGFVASLVGSFVGWLAWTGIVWLIGVKLFKHTSDFEELLRTLGFVFAPQILMLLGIIPLAILQGLLGIAVLAMTIVAFIRAVRQALDVDTGRAFFVSAMALVGYLLILLVVQGIAGRF